MPPPNHLELSNPELVEALRAIAIEDTSKRRRALYQALLSGILILPAPDEAIDEVGTTEMLEDEEPLGFLTFENAAGETVLMAFTDEDAALTWEPEGLSYIGLRGLDVVLIAAEHKIAELVLNPGSDEMHRLRRSEIMTLAGDEMPISGEDGASAAPDGTTVLIGPPEEMPPESWQTALAEVLEHYPSIDAAYFFQLHIPPEGPRHVIGLALYRGMTPPAQERLVETLLAELETLLPEEQTLDLVILEDRDFRATVQDTVPSIYQRPNA